MIKNNFLLFALLLFSPLVLSKELYSIEAHDAPIGDLVRLIAKVDNKNVVMPGEIKGTVNASFPSINLENALQVILKSQELGVLIQDDALQILPQKTLEGLGAGLITETIILKNAKVTTILSQISNYKSAQGIVTADARINAITVRDTPSFVANIKSYIKEIDQSNRQVLIEARIVEASTDFVRDLGIEWGASYSKNKLIKLGGFNGQNLMVNAPVDPKVAQSGINLNLGPFSGVSLDIQLTAAERNGQLTILSRPSIVTMNNQTAKITSGTSFYVPVQTNTTGASGASPIAGTGVQAASSLEKISAGIQMEVTPQITSDNKINLAINVTESQADFAQAINGVPAINDNSATTSVLLQDGEITVIGGLFQVSESQNKSGLPFLSNVPIISVLFGKQQKKNAKKELLVFIKPVIVKGAIDNLGTEKDMLEMKKSLNK